MTLDTRILTKNPGHPTTLAVRSHLGDKCRVERHLSGETTGLKSLRGAVDHLTVGREAGLPIRYNGGRFVYSERLLDRMVSFPDT